MLEPSDGSSPSNVVTRPLRLLDDHHDRRPVPDPQRGLHHQVDGPARDEHVPPEVAEPAAAARVAEQAAERLLPGPAEPFVHARERHVRVVELPLAHPQLAAVPAALRLPGRPRSARRARARSPSRAPTARPPEARAGSPRSGRRRRSSSSRRSDRRSTRDHPRPRRAPRRSRRRPGTGRRSSPGSAVSTSMSAWVTGDRSGFCRTSNSPRKYDIEISAARSASSCANESSCSNTARPYQPSRTRPRSAEVE